MTAEGSTSWILPALTDTHYPDLTANPHPINNRKGQLSLIRIHSPNARTTLTHNSKEAFYIIDQYGNGSTVSLEFNHQLKQWMIVD